MIDENTEQIDLDPSENDMSSDKSGKVKEGDPGKYMKEIPADQQLSRKFEKLFEAIKRGYMATQKYEEPWKSTVRRLLEFTEALTKVLAKVLK